MFPVIIQIKQLGILINNNNKKQNKKQPTSKSDEKKKFRLKRFPLAFLWLLAVWGKRIHAGVKLSRVGVFFCLSASGLGVSSVPVMFLKAAFVFYGCCLGVCKGKKMTKYFSNSHPSRNRLLSDHRFLSFPETCCEKMQ